MPSAINLEPSAGDRILVLPRVSEAEGRLLMAESKKAAG